ncbi:hypothetical protein NQZ68_005860 [Dissostichus eleginoides]|nr:hypothetical protein NQZ68_005860 [Dissostichus eleginoides]
MKSRLFSTSTGDSEEGCCDQTTTKDWSQVEKKLMRNAQCFCCTSLSSDLPDVSFISFVSKDRGCRMLYRLLTSPRKLMLDYMNETALS